MNTDYAQQAVVQIATDTNGPAIVLTVTPTDDPDFDRVSVLASGLDRTETVEILREAADELDTDGP